MPKELAIDLSALALYDTVIYADDSGSMESYDGERIDDLKLIMSKVRSKAAPAFTPQKHPCVHQGTLQTCCIYKPPMATSACGHAKQVQSCPKDAACNTRFTICSCPPCPLGGRGGDAV
jgi:hypothetical protein